MDGTERNHYCRAWMTHCCFYLKNDRSVGIPPRNIEDMLLTFAVSMQEGQFGLEHQIKVQSVKAALTAVS